MAITSYTQLKTAIANWLNRSDINDYIPDFITFCEKRIYRELRIKPLEATLNSTISGGVLAIPSDYTELKFAYVDGSPVQMLQRKSQSFIYTKYPTRTSWGVPAYICREGDNFIFGPYPDSNYTIKGVYYKQLDALSDSNTTNWFTSNAPDLLLFGSLVEAEPFLKNDARIGLWEAKFNQVFNQLQQKDNEERFSGSAMTQTNYTVS